MFKKIRSSRDPERTIWNELQGEFSPYFNKANKKSVGIIEKYPKQIFSIMLLVIVVSAVLASTVLRPDPAVLFEGNKETVITPDPEITINENSGGDFLSSLNLLQKTLLIKGEIEELLEQDVLSPQDSGLLIRKIDELKTIENNIK